MNKFFTLLLLSFLPLFSYAQIGEFQKETDYLMRIPQISAMQSSPIHTYILSESEGLIVFRSHPDSLEWLFTLEDVNSRGNKIKCDLRFAYLYGLDESIHVIEPTNLLGIYSVAKLNFRIFDIARIKETLFLSGENGEFGTLNLSTADSVTNSFTLWKNDFFSIGKGIKQIESINDNLIYLTIEDSLGIVQFNDKGVKEITKFKIDYPIESLFVENNSIFGSTYNGGFYQIDPSTKKTELIYNSSKFITQFVKWDSLYVLGKEDGAIDFLEKSEHLSYKATGESGNYFTLAKDKLWMSEYETVFKLKKNANDTVTTSKAMLDVDWQLNAISDKTIPYPKPVLVNFTTTERSVEPHLVYTLVSNKETAKMMANNLYWQPSPRDIGNHFFKVIASDEFGRIDSVTFNVSITAFNMPPKFTPFRMVSIPIDEEYQNTFRAIDPDGEHKNLIRYVGLDLPTGATLNEKTGDFIWTPTIQQVGKHEFSIIATDQFGTASSLDVIMNVLNVKRSQ